MSTAISRKVVGKSARDNLENKNTTSEVTITNYQLMIDDRTPFLFHPNSHTKRDSLLSTLAFVCREKIKHSRTLNPASHTKAGSHFLDTRKKDNWTQQHVYMAEKSIENRFDI